jgi:hypothetical protein
MSPLEVPRKSLEGTHRVCLKQRRHSFAGHLRDEA